MNQEGNRDNPNNEKLYHQIHYETASIRDIRMFLIVEANRKSVIEYHNISRATKIRNYVDVDGISSI